MEKRNWRKSEARVSLAKYWIVSFFCESGVLELKKVLKLLDFAVRSKLFLVCAIQSDLLCSSTSSDAGLDCMHLFF